MISLLLFPRPHKAEALSDDARLTSVCLTSVTYIGPKSRTERPRKTPIYTLAKGRGAGDLWTGAFEMYWLTN